MVAFRCLDASFSASSDPCSFLNWEMITKVRVASALAFVTWFIPIAFLFAPATLGVETVIQNQTHVMHVPTLDISRAESFREYAYTVNGTRSGQKYLGARSIIARLASASATTGQILPMVAPTPNSTYQQTFFAPYVQCERSNNEARPQLEAMIRRATETLGPSIEIISTDYFAAVPSISNETIPPSQPVLAANLTVDGAGRASNELFISIPQYSDTRPTVSSHLVPRYYTCSLVNASYRVRFRRPNGIRGAQIPDRTILNSVPYPSLASSDAAPELDMAYSTIMWALSTQLQGSITFQRDRNTTTAGADGGPGDSAGSIYSNIDTDMARTILLGASELDGHFRTNHALGANANHSSGFSPQRIQDKIYTGNRSFLELPPELSSNVTLSFFVDPLLAYISVPYLYLKQ